MSSLLCLQIQYNAMSVKEHRLVSLLAFSCWVTVQTVLKLGLPHFCSAGLAFVYQAVHHLQCSLQIDQQILLYNLLCTVALHLDNFWLWFHRSGAALAAGLVPFVWQLLLFELKIKDKVEVDLTKRQSLLLNLALAFKQGCLAGLNATELARKGHKHAEAEQKIVDAYLAHALERESLGIDGSHAAPLLLLDYFANRPSTSCCLLE